MKKKVAIIGTAGITAQHGGSEMLAAQLVQHLGHALDFTVYCAGVDAADAQVKTTEGPAPIKYIPLKASGLQGVLYATWSILHALRYADILLVLGVMGAWTFPMLRLLSKKKIVVAINGIDWMHSKWRLPARLLLRWSEKLAIKYAHADIADNEVVQDYRAMRYGTVSSLIAHGADHSTVESAKAQDKFRFPFLKLPFAVTVSSIEPENNVDMVLEAFSKLPKHRLVLIGNWNHSAFGKMLRSRYAGFSNLFLLDPMDDQRTLDMVRSHAHVYIHGQSAGGTNPALIEAMYLGLPVIAFGGSYNRRSTEDQAHYFHSAKSLIATINTLSTSELMMQAARMKAIADRRYRWEVVAASYWIVLDQVIQGKQREKVETASIRLDRMHMLDSQIGLQQVLPFSVKSSIAKS